MNDDDDEDYETCSDEMCEVCGACTKHCGCNTPATIPG